MAQRDSFKQGLSSPRIYTAMDDQAFQRIHIDSWSQLNWYVNFAQQDLKALSSEALGQLQHEITSIQRAFYGHMSRRYLSPQKLVKTQFAVYAHLTELADTGETYFSDFLVHGWVNRRDALSQNSQSETHNQILEYLKQVEGYSAEDLAPNPGRTVGSARQIRSFVSLTYLVPDPDQAFLFHLARLLGEFGDRLRRCRRAECNKVFLQERTTARFCSRECQSVTASALYRAREKQPLQQGKGKVAKKKVK